MRGSSGLKRVLMLNQGRVLTKGLLTESLETKLMMQEKELMMLVIRSVLD